MYQYAQKNSGYNTSIKKICSEKKDLVMFRFRKFLHEGFLLDGRLWFRFSERILTPSCTYFVSYDMEGVRNIWVEGGLYGWDGGYGSRVGDMDGVADIGKGEGDRDMDMGWEYGIFF